MYNISDNSHTRKNSFQNYVLVSGVELVSNICTIVALFFLARLYGIKVLAFATLIGVIIQFFFLWPALRRHGFSSGLRIDYNLPELKTIFRLAVPVAIGSGLYTINLFVDRVLASGLPAGSVAALNYASLIYAIPLVFISPAVSIVLYTVLADMFARRDRKRVLYTVKQALSLFTYLGFPMAAGIFLLAIPMVQIIYQRGAFQGEAVEITAAILAMYALGLPAYALREVFGRAFFAAGNTITPLYTGVLSLGVNIVLILVLVKFLLAPGLALANAIALWVGAISIMWAWNRQQKYNIEQESLSPFDRSYWVETGKIIAATLIMVWVVQKVWAMLQPFLTLALNGVVIGSARYTLIKLEFFSLTVLVGLIIYVLCTCLLKSDNAAYLWNSSKQLLDKLSDRKTAK